MTETTEANVGAHRGRPRPQNTIERDEQVYKALHAHGQPATRSQLVEKLNMKSSHVYLSLIRLRRDGYVRRVAAGTENAGSHTWEALNR